MIALNDLAASWIDPYTGNTITGSVVSVAYCSVTNTWQMLIAGDDGKFHSINPAAVDAETAWWISNEDDD